MCPSLDGQEAFGRRPCPYPRNPVFTGREEVLTRLADTLKVGRSTALSQPQAISGLGGIGKTQIAIEYAYRFHQNYQAVFWTLADTRESLISGFVAMAGLLNLPEKDEQDQTITVQAVMRWLTTHTKWLLILDNADDLAVVGEFLPSVFGGHILLTTCAQAMGRLASHIEVDIMSQDMGTLFLLRRTSLIPLNAPLEQAAASDIATAGEICEELGGLPLALDQAGAYIEETQCSLSDYQQRYQLRRALLLKRRCGLVADHPEPVATTWSLSFEKVEQKSPAAADLLRCCTFLAPDAIPEELFREGASELGPTLYALGTEASLLDEAIGILRCYSFIRRNRTEHTLSVHRLVQTVMQASMNQETQQQWAERVIHAVNEVFPSIDVTTWAQCKRLLPQAEVCADLIDRYTFKFLEAANLLDQTASYLKVRARYSEAEPLEKRALAIREQVLGPIHPDTASSLNNLAMLYHRQGKYEQAGPLFKRALTIFEHSVGPTHPYTANTLNKLAALYHSQGKYEQAELLFKRALAIYEQVLDPTHPDMAFSLNGLATLYHSQGKYEQAEPLAKRALAIREQVLGPTHPDTITARKSYMLLLQHMQEQRRE